MNILEELSEEEILNRVGTLTQSEWYHISRCNIFSETFFRECKDQLFFTEADRNITTIDFIREFRGRLNWTMICATHQFTTKQLEEFIEWIDWWKISVWQKLDEEFIWKYRDRLCIKKVFANPQIKMSKKFREKLKNYAILTKALDKIW